jgi:hypothetical protein
MNNSEVSPSGSMGVSKLSTLFLYYVFSPVLCAFSGFHLTSYLLVGLYTWPRTSRVLVLTVSTFIFVYEFIYKSDAPRFASGKTRSQGEWVLYTSMIPFAFGIGTILILVGF